MALTINVQQLAVHLRLSDGESVAEPINGILSRHLATATALIESYAPSAPVAVQNEAAIRLCGWLYDSPNHGIRGIQNGLSASGAAALLGRWRERRVEVVG